jgi:hypothetical protein
MPRPLSPPPFASGRKKLSVRALATAVITAAVLITAPQPGYAAQGDDLPFASAVFPATHNSYSGDLSGTRGSITEQLDSGVRFVEFDVWSGSYATNGDYSIGHSSAGDLVDHTGGNPAGNLLRPWLALVNTWSAAHPAAAPITVMLDLKDDPTTRTSYAQGNLGALNQEIGDVFGTRLVRSLDTAGALPSIGSLRGRVVTLLSGSATARTGYKKDTGSNPAIAVNANGQVVEVHDNGSGVLWYWTGVYGTNGQVTWLRHGKYDTGAKPAVALAANGTLVEVHQAPSGSNLWSRAGHLDATGEITWGPSAKYDTGALPTVAFTDATGTAFREIHQSQGSTRNWDWKATVTGSTIAWGAHATTPDARFPTSTSTANGHTVTVAAGTLMVTTDRAAAARIHYQQLAFVEYQDGDSAELKDGSIFWAATASDKTFILAARAAGVSARGWDFDAASLATNPLANYPATNTPQAAWYQTMLTGADVVA